MRRIFHIDMNSFFASCEQARNPELKGKNIAVAGDPEKRHGIILAASYSAKAFGIKTTMPVWKAEKLCPDLILLPCDFELYKSYSHRVMDIFREYAPVIEQASIDEAYLDFTGTEKIYPDVLELAHTIQDRIKNELDLCCSVGISENKLLAKMASDYKKPLGITEIYTKDVERMLWPMDVREMFMIGKSTAESLKSIGIYTIGDLAKFDYDTLAKHFGDKGASRLMDSANGLDDGEVIPNEEIEMKSNGAEKTFAEDIDDDKILKDTLFEFSERISKNLREYDKKAKTVVLKIKFSDFTSITRNITMNKATDISNTIYEYGCMLLDKNWDKENKIRLIGLSCTNFKEDDEFDQMTLFENDTNEIDDKDERISKLESVSDLLREKFGDNIVVKAKSIKKDKEDDNE